MLTDDELVSGFESATLPSFAHADHVRLTIVYLNRIGRDGTERTLLEGLKRFAIAKNVPGKFHVTMTLAWIDLVESARIAAGTGDSAAVVAAYPELLERNTLLRFYSAERLNSAAARDGWMPPDLAARIVVQGWSISAADRNGETDRV